MVKKKVTSQTLQTIYEVTKEQLNSQFQLVDSLDNKASVIIGFNAIVITLALGAYSNAFVWLFAIGLILLFISTFYSFYAYKTEQFRRDPKPRKFREKYSLKPQNQVLQKLVDNSIGSYEWNRNKLIEKSQRINIALLITFGGLYLLAISLLLGR